MREIRLAPALVTIAVSGVLLSTLTATARAKGAGPGAGLFRHHWVSTAVIKNGKSSPLVEGTRIRLRFRHEAERDIAGWSAGCNGFGASVDVKPRRLKIGVIDQTAMKCAEPIMRQERWVARFFRSDPKWHRTGRKLRLRNGDDVIKLRRRK